MVYLSAEIALDDADHCANEADEDTTGEKSLNETLEKRIRGKKMVERMDLVENLFGLIFNSVVLTLQDRDHVRRHLSGHKLPFHLRYCCYFFIQACCCLLIFNVVVAFSFAILLLHFYFKNC